MSPPFEHPLAETRRTSKNAVTDANPTSVLEKQSTLLPKTSSKKSAGFKPIGKSSASVKRFFPGEDDDIEITSHVSPGIHSRSPDPYTSGPERRNKQNSEPRATNGTSNVREGSILSDKGTDLLEDSATIPSPAQKLEEDRAEDPSLRSRSSKDELYAIVSQVGEGTFGKVYKAQNTISGVFVALKRIRMEAERDGFPVTAMREIKLLQSLRHENIVTLYEMMVSNGMCMFGFVKLVFNRIT